MDKSGVGSMYVVSSKSWSTIPIAFDDEELSKMQKPHFYPLVISIWICNTQVKRVLIDVGSNVDVLFYDAFQRIGLFRRLDSVYK